MVERRSEDERSERMSTTVSNGSSVKMAMVGVLAVELKGKGERSGDGD